MTAPASSFPYSDTNKRYHTYDYYLRHRYGGKCAKVTLDAGFTCPNIDGRRGVGGCIYCSPRGSGDFALCGLSIAEQYRRQTARIREKWDTPRFIPYLQAHTNTYAAPTLLRPLYEEVAALPGAVAMHIATRADCIDGEIAELLSEISEKIPLTVELGLQSVHDRTAARINRCHTYAEFVEGFALLRRACPRARIAVHLINGLPGESEEDMLKSARTLAELHPDEVKLHLLHVLRDTPLAALYQRGEYRPMERDAYIKTVVGQLLLLPSDIVIGRLTGDGAADALLAPLWSLRKLTVLNDIDKFLVKIDGFQGKMCKIHKK